MTIPEFFFSVSFWGSFPVAIFCLFLTGLLFWFVYSRKKLEWIFQYLGTIFERFTKRRQHALTQSFQEAMGTLKIYASNTNARSDISLYLMLGAPKTGKQTLLEKLDIPIPVDQSRKKSIERAPCDFWFFDPAVVINLRGDLFLEKDTTVSRHDEWKLFLRLLRSVRSDQPLEGVLLCVSVEELLTLDQSTLRLRATHAHNKLYDIQEMLGIRFPIYVVITKTDKIAGFTSFCQEIPENKHTEIFGWSNSYALDVPYQDAWVDDIFNNLRHNIIRAQQDLFATKDELIEKDGVALFPEEFNKLKDPLSAYLSSLFSKARLKNNVLLRGLYFTGHGTFDYTDIHHQTNKQEELEPKKEHALQKGSDLVPSTQKVQKIYFCKQLFQEKIFAEKGLAIPLWGSFFARNYALRWMQSITLLTGTALFLSLFLAYRELDHKERLIRPHIEDMGSVVQRAILHKEKEALEHTFFQKQAQALLPAIARLHNTTFHSWILPFSWISPLETQIQRVIEVSYQEVIFKAIVQKLNDEIKTLVTRPSLSANVGRNDSISILENPHFKALSRYVTKLKLTQDLSERYNNLKQGHEIKDFVFLVKMLFGYQVPKRIFEGVDDFFSSFFSRTHDGHFIRFFKYSNQALDTLLLHKDRFVKNAFQVENTVPNLSELMTQLKKFAQGGEYLPSDLKALSTALTRCTNALSGPKADWISQLTFAPGPEFEELIKDVALINLFPAETTDHIKLDCQAAFEQMKAILQSYHAPHVGKMFVINEKGHFSLATDLLHFQGLLNLLLSQPFMSAPPVLHTLRRGDSKTIVTWQEGKLKEASVLIQNFRTFFKERITSISPETKALLKKVCFRTLKYTLSEKVYEAQEVSLANNHLSTLAPEDAYQNIVQNIRKILPVVGPLLTALKEEGLTDLYTSLRDVLHEQALLMIEKINAIYEAEAPYEARHDIVGGWYGDPRQIFAAFGASSQQDLKNYLTNQRERLRYLATHFAEPAVDLLKILYTSDASSLPHLMLKWSDILTQLSFYARNAPNTLRMLENFILSTLPALTLEGCPVALHLSKNPEGIDYFLDRINALRRLFADQCKKANNAASRVSYKRLTNLFNETLAGRYPFVPRHFDTQEEVSLETIKNFFAVFDREGPYVKEFLNREIGAKPHYKKALTFIKKIESVRPFFRLCIASAKGGDTSSLPLAISFRTNTEQEQNAEQLMSWSLTTKDKTIFAKDSEGKVFWEQDSTLKVHFRWALGSLQRPVPSTLQPALKTDSVSATFVYEGTWALLRMLQAHSAHATDNPADPGQTLLRFQISTALKESVYPTFCGDDIMPSPETQTMLVFMNISMPGGKKNTPLIIPEEFPFMAPTLSALEAEGKTKRSAQNIKPSCPAQNR